MNTCIHTSTYIHTYIHTNIHTDIQTYRHTDIQTYRHTDIQTYRHTDIQTYRGSPIDGTYGAVSKMAFAKKQPRSCESGCHLLGPTGSVEFHDWTYFWLVVHEPS